MKTLLNPTPAQHIHADRVASLESGNNVRAAFSQGAHFAFKGVNGKYNYGVAPAVGNTRWFRTADEAITCLESL